MLQCLMHKGLQREAVLKSNIFCIAKVIILSSVLFLAGGCGRDEAVGFDEQEIILSGQQLNTENEDSGLTESQERKTDSGPGSGAAEDNDISGNPVHEERTFVTVYVCGAVMLPGVYTFEEGTRVVDAVNMAGGMSPEADSNYVNQALPLSDGQKIYIPLKSETEGMIFAGETQGGMQDDGNMQGSLQGESSRISLNTATEAELMTLPGIGRAKAALIIEYRETNGGFASIEDIMKISGIKEGMFNKIRDKITI